MKRATYFIIVFLTVAAIFSFGIINRKKCVHKNIPYSTADYSEYKKEYASLFNRVAKDKFDDCICGKMPSSFNSKIRYNEYTSITIEPIFVNLQDCNGIYAQRIYGKYSALYSNGGIPHSLFIIKNNSFIELIDLDSIQIKSILISDTVFSKTYNKVELDSIYEIVKKGVVWSDASELAPYYVKDNGKKIYDAFHE